MIGGSTMKGASSEAARDLKLKCNSEPKEGVGAVGGQESINLTSYRTAAINTVRWVSHRCKPYR